MELSFPYSGECLSRETHFKLPTACKDVVVQSTRMFEEIAKLLEEQRSVEPENEKLQTWVKQKGLEYQNSLDIQNNLRSLEDSVSDVCKKAVESSYISHASGESKDWIEAKVPRVERELELNYTHNMVQYMNKPQSERLVASLEAIRRFHREIWNISHDADEEMPPIETFFEDYNPDDELIEEQAVLSYKCPLTQQYFVNPVTSSICGHSFSYLAIMDIFNKSGRSIVCPVPGCRKSFTVSNLSKNPSLERATEARKKRDLEESLRQNATLDRL